MRIRDLSLRSKIVFGGISIVLIPLVIVGTVTFIYSSHALEDISKVQAVQIAKSMSGMVEIAIEKDLKILGATANDPFIVKGASEGRYEGMEEKLSDLYIKIGADYEGLAVYDQEGVIRSDGVDSSRVGITIYERNYFQAAKEGKTDIGPVVSSKATGMPIFAFSAPIMSEEGEFLGGVLAVVKADFLVRYIASLKLGQTGFSFMLDQNGIIIAHPNQEYILKLDATREEGLEEISGMMIRRETGTAEYTHKKIKRVAGFTPVELTGWSVGVAQNKDEIMALAYTNRNLILVVSGLFLLLTILAVFFFSKTISVPVQKRLTTLNQAIEQATEGIGIIGLDRRVSFVNPAMAEIIDCPIQELIGKAPYLENKDMISDEEIWRLLEQGRIWSGCITGVKKGGDNFSMDITITPVRDEAGKISSFLAIGRDITRELKMEAQLRQGQKMEAIGTLAGGIAHDFNNILSAIFGYTELTIQSLDDQEKSMHYLEEIFRAAVRARDLVTQILTFSRQADQQKKTVSPKHIIKESLKLIRASLPSTIEIRESVESDASILADPTQVHQIILNLCTNAGHAMKERGGVLVVVLDDIDLDQGFAQNNQGIRPGRHVLLKVSDTGYGIPPEDIDRVFDPFFTTKPQGEGTGLGLSVVHGIVKALNGIISVTSEIGKGTTFTIYLPVIMTGKQDMEYQTLEDVPGGSERLMLVDDESALIRTGKDLLEGLGYRVQGFEKSLAALETFKNDPYAFDAIVTDYTMPQMTGYELAKGIREIREDIPIILYSGYLDKEMELKIQDAGINEFVKKPITRRDIALVLRRAIDQSENPSH